MLIKMKNRIYAEQAVKGLKVNSYCLLALHGIIKLIILTNICLFFLFQPCLHHLPRILDLGLQYGPRGSVSSRFCPATLAFQVYVMWTSCLVVYERVYLPLWEVADTPFHIQGGEVFTSSSPSSGNGHMMNKYLKNPLWNNTCADDITITENLVDFERHLATT